MKTIDGVALDEDQTNEWTAIREEVGSDGLADQVFGLCYVHDDARWVPLDLFEMAERDPAHTAYAPEDTRN